jgi:hypothetical protein
VLLSSTTPWRHTETAGIKLNAFIWWALEGEGGASIAQRYSSGLRGGWSGIRVLAETGNFSLHHWVKTGSGAHTASYPMGTRPLSLGAKRHGRETDHSPPSSAEVKNAWSYTSTPQYSVMEWCSVKAQGKTLPWLDREE